MLSPWYVIKEIVNVAAVRTSGYWCTWKVCWALEKLELLLTIPNASFMLSNLLHVTSDFFWMSDFVPGGLALLFTLVTTLISNSYPSLTMVIIMIIFQLRLQDTNSARVQDCKLPSKVMKLFFWNISVKHCTYFRIVKQPYPVTYTVQESWLLLKSFHVMVMW